MPRTLIHRLRHRGMVWRAVYRPDGAVLATFGDGKSLDDVTEVRLWNACTGVALAPWIQLRPQFERGDLLFSPDGKLLATGGPDKLLQFWDTESGRRTGTAIKHRSRINCLAFHPLRDWVLAGCADKHLYVWDIRAGKPVIRPSLHRSEVYDLAFAPDRKTLAVQCKGMTVQLWNSKTWRRIGDPLVHRLRVNHVRFSPADTILLTSSEDRLIRFWNSRTGKLYRRRPLAIGGWVQAVTYSPEGLLLLTGNEHTPYKDLTCEAQLWHATTGEPIGNPIRHETRCIMVARFSPNGKLAVTGGEDGRLVITTVPDGNVIAVLKHKFAVYDAQFSPDSRQIVTSCTDNSARIWSIDSR